MISYLLYTCTDFFLHTDSLHRRDLLSCSMHFYVLHCCIHHCRHIAHWENIFEDSILGHINFIYIVFHVAIGCQLTSCQLLQQLQGWNIMISYSVVWFCITSRYLVKKEKQNAPVGTLSARELVPQLDPHLCDKSAPLLSQGPFHRHHPTNTTRELFSLQGVFQVFKEFIFLCISWPHTWKAEWDNKCPALHPEIEA